MKKLFTLASITLLAFNASAQNVVASNAKSGTQVISQPAVTITDDALLLKETEFDFGKIPQGKPVTHIFDVANNGKDSLHISNIQASCGCTTPEWDRDKVQAPGEKTKITV